MKKHLKFVLPALFFAALAMVYLYQSTRPALAFIKDSAGLRPEFGETPVLLRLAPGQEAQQVTHNVFVRSGDCLIVHAACNGPVAPDMGRELNGERYLLAPACTVSRQYASGEFVRHWIVTLRSGGRETIRHVMDAPRTAPPDIPSLRRLPLCSSGHNFF